MTNFEPSEQPHKNMYIMMEKEERHGTKTPEFLIKNSQNPPRHPSSGKLEKPEAKDKEGGD